MSSVASEPATAPARRRGAVWALGLYVLAVVVLQLRVPGGGPFGDEPEYAYLAGRLSGGHGYTFGPSAHDLVPGGSFAAPGRGTWWTADPAEAGPSRPTAWRQPGVPVALAAIDTVVPGAVRDEVPATRRVWAVLLALHAPLLLVVGTQIGHRDAGIAAALVWIADPVSRFFATHLLAEGLASLLVCAALAALLHARSARRRSPAACAALSGLGGLALGAAVLTRAYLGVLLVLVVAWALAARPGLGRRAVAALVVGAALLPAAWVVRNAVRLDSATLSTQTWEQVYVGNDSLARGSWAGSRADRAQRTRAVLSEDPDFFARDEPGREAVLRRMASAEVRDHPVRTVLRLPKKAAITLASPTELSGRDPVWLVAVVLLAALLGLPRLRRRVPGAIVALLLAPLAAVVLASVVTFGETRFRVPATGPVLLLAAVATRTLASLVRDRTTPR